MTNQWSKHVTVLSFANTQGIFVFKVSVQCSVFSSSSQKQSGSSKEIETSFIKFVTDKCHFVTVHAMKAWGRSSSTAPPIR